MCLWYCFYSLITCKSRFSFFVIAHHKFNRLTSVQSHLILLFHSIKHRILSLVYKTFPIDDPKVIKELYIELLVLSSFVNTHRLCNYSKMSLQEHMGSPTVLSAVRFGRSLVFCVVFLRALFVLLFFFWPLCCLSLFNSQILITPFGIFKLKHTRKYWSFENSNLTWSNISLLNNLMNHLVLYNDTYIEVLRSPPSIVV